MTKDERKHLSKVAALGCVVCRRVYGEHDPAPVELHHPRSGVGMGRRSSHYDAIPVCPEHHRGATGFHGLGTKGFPKRYGFTEADLLEDVKRLTQTDC